MIQNLFEKAISSQELADFALGKGDYYVIDREYGEHWISGSWLQYILPHIDKIDKQTANDEIIRMFNALLNYKKITIEEKIFQLLQHLHVFYYLKSTGKIDPDFSIIDIEIKINKQVDAYREILMNETKLINEKSDRMDQLIDLIKRRGGMLSPPL
jgi:hypothetical protein